MIQFTIRSGKTFPLHLKPGFVETPPLLGRKAERHGLSGESGIKVFMGCFKIHMVWKFWMGRISIVIKKYQERSANINHSKIITRGFKFQESKS